MPVADLAVRLKVFIASPSDVLAERDVVEEELRLLQRECARGRLLLDVYRWENNTTPTHGRIQAQINTHLRASELTIAIIWSTLGSAAGLGETGSQTELRIAGERVAAGFADDVFLYFKTAEPPATAAPEAVAGARQFREGLRKRHDGFAIDFAGLDEFRDRLRRDLRIWLERWRSVPDICSYALRKSPGEAAPAVLIGESRLARLKQQFDPTVLPDSSTLGLIAMWAYQENGPAASERTLPKPVAELAGAGRGIFNPFRSQTCPSLRPLCEAGVLVPDDEWMRFGNPEWFWFFCAVGLCQSIAEGNVHAVERRPYVNPIHQYLQGLAVGAERDAIVARLRAWLVNDNGVTEGKPIARNFAAYELGMLHAIEAQEDLARVIDEDPGVDVRTYCIASLGRMRARAQLPFLADLFNRSDDGDLRLTIAQSVSRMVGVAEYPL